MQKNVFSLIIIVIISLEYINECNGYHLMSPESYNITRFKRQSNCRRNEFACKNGQCIINHNYCDGKTDCTDGSDEILNCNTRGCSTYTFRCAYGACVDGDAKCNGVQDCRDNSDESNCDGSTNNNCGSKFGCKSGECIDKYLACDGTKNCPDGSDETLELCSKLRCNEFSFRCAYGACVDGDTKCDGKQDCVDNSDEDPNICGGGGGGGVTPISLPGEQDCVVPSIRNGRLTVSGVDYATGSLVKDSSTITIACNRGFTLSVNSSPKCINGQWSIELPKCVPETDTPVLQPTNGECFAPSIENGIYELGGNAAYIQGNPIPNFGLVQFKCISDIYALTTNSTLFCLNGKYNGEIPKCTQSCAPKFSSSVDVKCDLNGREFDCTKRVPEGTIATMTCKKHYIPTIEGDSTAVCLGGSWDIGTKKCIPECGDLIPEGTILVVNGVNAKRGEFPWHVAVYREVPGNPKAYICGGSIISVKVVVSAAHCFSKEQNGVQYPISEFHVAAGKYFSNWNAPDDVDSVQKRKVSKIEFPSHTYYGYESLHAGDIAVVVVDEPFELTNLVKPVCVDWDSNYVHSQLRSNAPGQVVGWGATNVKNPQASVDLKQLTVPYLDRGQCVEVIPSNFRQFVTLDKFCAGYTNGSSVCNGDSGGGLVFPHKGSGKEKFYLQGIVSVGPTRDSACDNNQIGVYTKVQTYVEFIRKLEARNRVI